MEVCLEHVSVAGCSTCVKMSDLGLFPALMLIEVTACVVHSTVDYAPGVLQCWAWAMTMV